MFAPLHREYTFNKHLKMFIVFILIISMLFRISPIQEVLAATYVDTFATAPFTGHPGTIITGSYPTGLIYECYTNCYFNYDSNLHTALTEPSPNAAGGTAFYISASNQDAFVLSSVDLLALYPVTIIGHLSGAQVFTVTVPPSGGGFETITLPNTNVTMVTFTSSQNYIAFKNVTANLYASLVSFRRYAPSFTPTNYDSLVFQATFSEGVQNVTADDFILNSTPTTSATITNISASSDSIYYYITVSGGDLANFNGEVSLDLSASHDITTLGGEQVSTRNPTYSYDESFTVDNVKPAMSINQSGLQPDPTSSSYIDFIAVSDKDINAATFSSDDVDLSASTATYDSINTAPIDSKSFYVTVHATSPGTVVANLTTGTIRDLSGNTNTVLPSTDNSVTFDNVWPNVTINQASGQADPTNTNPIYFTAVFDEPIDVSSFTVDDINFGSSTATIGTVSITEIAPLDSTTFQITVNATSDGTVIPTILFGYLSDLCGNPNNDSTSTDNTVTFDSQQPTVTINQESAQTDPTSSSPINFSVVFSEPVSDFGSGDVILSGTAGASTAVISGSGTTYNVAVSGMNLDGTVIASIDAAVAHDATGNANIASTSTDNEVTFDGDPVLNLQRPGGTVISNGGTDLLGNRLVGSVTLTYTVDNTAGTDTLIISAVNASNLLNSSNFHLLSTTPISVPGGTTSTFDISVDVNSTGSFSLQMHTLSNDSDIPDYSINMEGTGYYDPEMDINFNSVSITDGDSTPSTTDGTDFGEDLYNYADRSPEHTFTILNTGAGTLQLTNTPRVTVTGTDFSLVTDAPSSIAPGEQADFVVRFSATSIGTISGTISIASNDPDENPYNFSIAGTGYSGPLMVVQGGSPLQDIENGDTTPDAADNTEFLAAAVSGGTIDHFFTIQNVGNGPLSLSGSPVVSIGGTNAADFTVILQPLTSIGSGANDTFTIRFDPGAAGNRTATVSIANDDPNNNPYTFTIEGQGDDFSVLAAGNTSPTDGAVLSSAPGSLRVQFSRNALADGSADAANYTGNYLLVEDGLNDTFDTVSCAGGVVSDDVQLAINSITYNTLSTTATLSVNSGDFISGASYRLYVCGTTSINDTFGNELNGGTSDTIINFSVIATSTSATALPATGFPIGHTVNLPKQPLNAQYVPSGMTLVIPSLQVSLPIVGVPQVNGIWDVSWLGDNAGYLANTAYPTWNGNTVITAHVWNTLNQPGPFANLKSLKYGDRIEIHAYGEIYIYEVHDSRKIATNNIAAVIKHEQFDWLTLLTCENYNEDSNSYTDRRLVRAVLVDKIEE